MNASKLRDLSSEELTNRMDEASRELFDIKVGKATADETDNPLKARLLRREIARMKTLIRERQDVK